MSGCKGLSGRLFGHDYQPRYSVGTPTFRGYPKATYCSEYHYEQMVEISKPRTYHGDVCRRCGDVKNQPK